MRVGYRVSYSKARYCPFCSLKILSASGVFIVPRRGLGPAFESAADLLMPMFLDSFGFWVIFSIVSSYFSVSAALAFLAAALCSGVILAIAAFLASASCFILACSAGVKLVEVLSSAKADADASASAPAVRIARVLFMS